MEFKNLPELDPIADRLSRNFGGLTEGSRGSPIVSDRGGLHAGPAGNLVRGAFAILPVSVRSGLYHVFLLWLLRAFRGGQELGGKSET